MKYNKSDAIGCFPAGVYDATVEAAIETTSKKTGADMLVITFKVYSPNGREQALKDYVVNPTGLWRLKKLAKALGRMEEFDSGVFREEHYVGGNLKLELEVEEDDQYGDKNRIKAWLPSTTAAAPASATTRTTVSVNDVSKALDGVEPEKDDDCPFD